jgi:hypothetical protein
VGGCKDLKPAENRKGGFFLICHLALFLFADIPESIYTQRLPLEEQKTAENEARFSQKAATGDLLEQVLTMIKYFPELTNRLQPQES